MVRKALTDRTLKSLKPARKGKHYDRWEGDDSAFASRILA